MQESASSNFISPALEPLIRAHDGNCALLYLWHLARGSTDAEAAALELCMTRSEVDSSLEKLRRMGLLTVSGGAAPAAPPAADQPAPSHSHAPENPIEELPEYTADEVEACLRQDPAFLAIRDKAQSVLGKPLGRTDLSRLLGIYSYLGLPAEVVLVLLQSCEDLSVNEDGSLRRPTAAYIERQAYAWVRRGIRTMETAEAYAEEQKALHSALGRIRRILEIHDRNLTSSERNYIAAWIGKKFDDAAIAAAYERTVDSIGKRSLPYMDKILMRWDEEGLHTLAEIERAGKLGKNPSGKPAGEKGSRFVPTIE